MHHVYIVAMKARTTKSIFSDCLFHFFTTNTTIKTRHNQCAVLPEAGWFWLVSFVCRVVFLVFSLKKTVR